MGKVVQVPTTRPHTRILWGEDSNLLCMAWSVLKRYELKHTITHNYRILHGMAVACRPGGVGGLPLRPLHSRSQRQCPGGVQWGGQEVRTAHHFHQTKAISHDIFPKFPMDLGLSTCKFWDVVELCYFLAFHLIRVPMTPLTVIMLGRITLTW